MRHTQKLRIWYENILFLVGDEHLVETNQNNLVAEKKQANVEKQNRISFSQIYIKFIWFPRLSKSGLPTHLHVSLHGSPTKVHS